ncbi:MAG: lamin tail domain-containing protein, partial [Elusimicrobia bacterium]|nr:lamin tail domain-containing protein [Elusimicrobiota bacterium]
GGGPGTLTVSWTPTSGKDTSGGDETFSRYYVFCATTGFDTIGLSDAVDNDGDGCADEERLDGIDNDGDGSTDEDINILAADVITSSDTTEVELTKDSYNQSLNDDKNYYVAVVMTDEWGNESNMQSYSYYGPVSPGGDSQDVFVTSVSDGTNSATVLDGSEYLRDLDSTVSFTLNEDPGANTPELYYDDDADPTDGTSDTASGSGTSWSATVSAADANVTDGAAIRLTIKIGTTWYYKTGTTPWSYIVDGAAPTNVGGDTPSDNSTDLATSTDTIALSATDSGAGGIEYYIQVATDTGFTKGLQSSGWQTTLIFSPTLITNTTYFWHVKAKDSLSNETVYCGDADTAGYHQFTTEFNYTPVFGDIVINEILADTAESAPVVAVDDNDEFIELYNNTAYDIDVVNWIFDDGDAANDTIEKWTYGVLNEVDVTTDTTVIPAGEYAVILDQEYVSGGIDLSPGNQPYDFPADTVMLTFGNADLGTGLAESDIPDVVLKDVGGVVISSWTYCANTGQASGHSVEMLDYAMHNVSSNWGECTDDSQHVLISTGHFSTPGAQNSVYSPNTAPNAPTLTSPTDDNWINDITPTFEWSFSDDDAGDSQGAYRIQIDDDINFGSIIEDPGKTSSASESYTSSNLNEGQWYWQVKTWDSFDAEGPYSSTYTVKIDTTPPTNASDISGTPPLNTWSKSAILKTDWTAGSDELSGLEGYSVEWDTNTGTTPDDTSDIGSGVVSDDTSDTYLDKSFDSWYFHIKAVDNAGNISTFTAHYGPYWLDHVAPSTCTLTAAAGAGNEIDLSWTFANDVDSGIDKYRLYRATETITDGNKKDSYVTELSTFSVAIDSYTDTTAVSGTNYYYCLEIIDNVGNTNLSNSENIESAFNLLDVWHVPKSTVPGTIPAVNYRNPSSPDDTVLVEIWIGAASQYEISYATLYYTTDGASPVETSSSTNLSYSHPVSGDSFFVTDSSIPVQSDGTTVKYMIKCGTTSASMDDTYIYYDGKYGNMTGTPFSYIVGWGVSIVEQYDT